MAWASVTDAQPGLHVFTASGFWQRLGGLLVRARLLPGQALRLEPCNSVHTAFMRYPIDVVFLDAAGRILKIQAGLRPWRVSGCLRAHACLELLAGEAARMGWRVGSMP